MVLKNVIATSRRNIDNKNIALEKCDYIVAGYFRVKANQIRLDTGILQNLKLILRRGRSFD